MEGRREGRTPASGCRAHSLLYTSPCAQDKAGRTGLNLPDSHKVTKGDRTGTQAFLDSHFSTEHTCVCAVSSRVSIRVEQPSTQMLRDTGRRTHTVVGVPGFTILTCRTCLDCTRALVAESFPFSSTEQGGSYVLLSGHPRTPSGQLSMA